MKSSPKTESGRNARRGIGLIVVLAILLVLALSFSMNQSRTPQELKETYFAPGINETLDAMLRQTDIASTQQAGGVSTALP